MRVKQITRWLVAAGLCLAVPAVARDRFEAGALAAGSFYRGADVNSAAGSGSVGFQPGPGGGLFLGQDLGDRLGGELRYVYSHNDLRLKSGGAEATFNGQAHVLHYDLLFYTAKPDAHVRPYLAGGGGLKVYQGTGIERPFQPLSNLALLTKTRDTMGVVDFGAGVKVNFSNNLWLRVEVRDYITEVPKVFTASPGAGFNGLMHQWTPAFGIGWTF